ncbi:hypothetical protein DU504_11230 [Haloplanus salinus]|uniref:DUF7282 domain-containing protein n=1 Tax=Haloplanus salinus TaxID=1126245 RepID=A0A368NC64_9EURY|nr:hypothetical protein [Haloplanus salinus]RCU47816.1 hypothetical protein DU504_11230 [Haloplanus salinus]
MRPLVPLLAFAVVVSVTTGVAAAGTGGSAPTADAGADRLRSVAISGVGPVNDSNRSGVHPVEAGSTLLVRGTTNRRPDDNAIDVSVIDGPDADRFGFVVVDSWGYDGLWTARLSVPSNATPGTYLLEVRVDGDSDVQPFEVTERRPAVIERASLSDASRTVAGESVPPGAVAVENVTLPDGGYVEVRDGDALAGRSASLAPGRHAVVVVPVEGVDDGNDLRAVAVRGTADAVGGPYRRNGTPVAVAVSSSAGPTSRPGTARPSPSPAATPTPTPTPTTGAGPGFGGVVALLAVVAALGIRGAGRS